MDISFEDQLRVVKWEVDPTGSGKYIAGTLGFFPLPGCPRIQRYPSLFSPKHIDTMYQVTEKLDGRPIVAYHVTNDSSWIRGLVPLPKDSKEERGC
jgi:hypothetical protein